MKLFSLVTLLLFLIGCKVTYVPDYDASIESEIVETAKANDKIYIELLDADPDKRGYKNFESEYITVEADINSIELKNEVRKSNSDMLDIINNHLLPKFIQYKTEHKNATNPLSNAEIEDYQMYIRGYWKALLLAEQGLPHTIPNN
jgi:hypothetical protein